MSLYEIVGVAFGLLSVYLTVRQSVWCWPTGIVSVLAFAVLFYEIKLYADVGLQFFFLVTSLQGWYYWLHGGHNKTELPISTLTHRQTALLVLGSAASSLAIGWAFDQYTDAHIPFWDAAASGLSAAAQLLLMRKKLENWYLWIAVDGLSIGIYVYKGVYLTAGLYGLFLALAISGLIEWQRTFKAVSPDRGGVAQPARPNPKPVKRVLIYGPESTGKSTLASKLAAHYNTQWAPEYARDYIEAKGNTFDYADITRIAIGQIESEEAAAGAANHLLFCDTDLITTTIYSRHYFGQCPEFVRRAADERRYDLYLMTDIDLPWETDPQRDLPHRREEFRDIFRHELEARGIPYIIIGGLGDQRLQAAIRAVDSFIKSQRP